MTKLDFDYFLDRFRQMDTTQLLQNALERELTSAAAAALRMVLTERGVEGNRFEQAVLDARQAMLLRSGATNQCDYCGRGVAFGALRDGGQKFCSEKCQRECRLHQKAFVLAPDLIEEHALRIAAGPCPRCTRVGQLVEMRPIDSCVSVVIAFFPDRSAPLLCRRCAVRAALTSSLGTLLLSWWSLPGLIYTPIALWRNLRWMLRDRFDDLPTPGLRRHAALDLAARFSGEPGNVPAPDHRWHAPAPASAAATKTQ